MDHDEQQTAGGKAPRTRRWGGGASEAQPAGGSSFISRTLRSPLAAAAWVRGAISPRPHHSQERETIQPEPPAAPVQAPAPTTVTPQVEVVDMTADQPVPTLPARPASNGIPFSSLQKPESTPAKAHAHTHAPGEVCKLCEVVVQGKQGAPGWSASKLNSLNFFLKGSTTTVAPGAAATTSKAPAPLPALERQTHLLPDTSSSVTSHFLGLKYLLEPTEDATPFPESWLSNHQPRAPRLGQGVSGLVTNQPGCRYHPYSLPGPSRVAQAKITSMAAPPQWTSQATTTPIKQHTPAPVPLALTPPAPIALTPPPSSLPGPSSLASTPAAAPAASAESQGTGLTGKTDMMGTRLALANARLPGTPYPSAAAIAAAAAGQGTSAGKRTRGPTPAATPLAGSGIRNLSDYKRQRQRYLQPGRSPAGLSGGTTPRDAGSRSASASAAATPAGSESVEATPAAQGRQVVAGTPQAGGMTTDTARRILETLDSMAKAADNANVPSSLAPPTTTAKHLLGTTPRAKLLDKPGSTPYPMGPPPPVDRITPLTSMATPAGAAAGRMFGQPSTSNMPTPIALFPGGDASLPGTPSLASKHDKTPVASSAALTDTPATSIASLEQQQQPALPVLPSFVPSSLVVAPATDALAGLKPASNTKPRSADKQPKSVRFAVPDEGSAPPPVVTLSSPAGGFKQFETDATPARSTPASEPSAKQQQGFGTPVQFGLSPPKAADLSVPLFKFGGDSHGQDDVLGAVARISKTVDSNGYHGELPKFSFGAADKVAQAGGKLPAQPPAVAFRPPPALLQEVLQAAAMPLPDDDEDEAPEQQQQAAPKAAAPAPVSSGWGDALLNKAAASFAAASAAVAQDIEKAKNPQASTTTSTTPAAGGFSFGAAAAAPAFGSTATGAKDAGAAAGNQAAGFGGFGSTPAPAADKPAAAEKPAVVSSGWGDAFLKSNQASISAATAATAQEIEKAKNPSPSPAAAASPAGSFTFGVTPGAAPAGGGAAASAPAFSFGGGGSSAPSTTTTPAPAPTSTPGAGFGFGSAFAGTPGTTPAVGTTAFGEPKASPFGSVITEAAAPSTTGTPVQGVNLFGTPATGGSFSFGGPQQGATGAAATSAAALASSVFGSTGPAFGSAATPAAGDPSAPSAFGAGSSPAFGLTSSGATPAGANSTPGFGGASAAPVFGSPFTIAPDSAAPASAAPSGAFTFGQSQGTASTAAGQSGTPATPPFMFGSTPAPAATSAPAASWGAAAPTTSTTPATNTGFQFGAAQATPAPAFGAANTPPSAAPAAAPFGNAAAGFNFGASNPAPAQSSPAFGGGMNFGGGAAATPAAAPAPSFGFGGPSPATPTGAAGFAFGAAQQGGAPNPFNATPSPAPTFGSVATPATFGGVTANAGSTPFAFGGGMTPGSGFGGMPQPAFNATPPQQPGLGAGETPGTGAGGGGLSLSLNDVKSGDRRKVRVRRHG